IFGFTPLNMVLSALAVVYGIIGIVDDSKVITQGSSSFKKDHMLRRIKFILETAIGVVFSHLLITTLGLSQSLFNYTFITFLFTSYTNAFNINDGLDGLLTGQAVWIFTGMLILTILQNQTTAGI